MPALTTSQRTLFDVTQIVHSGYVYILQPDLIFEAPLSGVTTSNDAITHVIFGPPTTGAYTNIELEQTVELVDANGQFMGRNRVRAAASPVSIPVGRCSKGRQDGELDTDNATIVRVYNERRIWAKIPWIDPSNGAQKKDEQTYPGDSDAMPPVANIGPDVIYITSASSRTIHLDAYGDIDTFATANSATISSYLWDIADGTIQFGGALTHDDIYVSFPQGYRYVSLTVTDSNGTTHTVYKLIVVATESDCIPVEIKTEQVRQDGVKLRLKAYGEQFPTTIRDGSKVLYTSVIDHNLGDHSGYMIFSGFMGDINHKLDDARTQQRVIEFECHDAAARLKQLPSFPQSVDLRSSATGWYRLPNLNLDRFITWFWHWHSNILDLADFAWSGVGSSYPLPRIDTDGQSMLEQGARLARSVDYVLTCNRSGQFQILGDPVVLPTATQASTYSTPTQRTSTVITTLTEDDYGEFEFMPMMAPKAHWFWASAVIASSTEDDINAAKAVAPGKAPGHGASSTSRSEMLVTDANELLVRAGNYYHNRVNPRRGKLRLDMVKSYHANIEPALMEIITVVAPEEEQERYGLSASGENYVLVEMTNAYRNGVKSSTWILEPILDGPIAETPDEASPC